MNFKFFIIKRPRRSLDFCKFLSIFHLITSLFCATVFSLSSDKEQPTQLNSTLKLETLSTANCKEGSCENEYTSITITTTIPPQTEDHNFQTINSKESLHAPNITDEDDKDKTSSELPKYKRNNEKENRDDKFLTQTSLSLHKSSSSLLGPLDLSTLLTKSQRKKNQRKATSEGKGYEKQLAQAIVGHDSYTTTLKPSTTTQKITTVPLPTSTKLDSVIIEYAEGNVSVDFLKSESLYYNDTNCIKGCKNNTTSTVEYVEIYENSTETSTEPYMNLTRPYTTYSTMNETTIIPYFSVATPYYGPSTPFYDTVTRYLKTPRYDTTSIELMGSSTNFNVVSTYAPKLQNIKGTNVSEDNEAIWPVKLASIVEGDIILGGLMMVSQSIIISNNI